MKPCQLVNYLHVECPYDKWVILLLGDFVTADLSDPAAPLFRERKSAGGATGEAHRGGDVRIGIELSLESDGDSPPMPGCAACVLMA